MADEEEVRMLAEITRLYYEEEWTQQRIAKKFNMSRSLVSKLLSKARKIGIVEIIIHDEEFHPYRKLEEELKKRFQIKEAVCVSVENSEIPVKTVGAAAAKYLARKLSSVKYVAIVGLGSSPQYFELTESYLHGINREKNDISRQLIGDISYNYFDRDGKLIDCKWNRQLMSLNIDEIKRIPEVIAVTEGTEKVTSIYSALKHKIVDGLITDVQTGRELVEMDNRRLMGKD